MALVRFSAFVAGAGGCSGNRVDAAVVGLNESCSSSCHVAITLVI